MASRCENRIFYRILGKSLPTNEIMTHQSTFVILVSLISLSFCIEHVYQSHEAITIKLGVCYYPEQWYFEPTWQQTDPPRMQELGLTYIRMAEFAWSLMEPSPGVYSWEWLDQVLEEMQQNHLQVVLGTPTATPPRWIIDEYPSVLPVDSNNNTRRYGSRRHYTFSSEDYLNESLNIVTQMVQRYGNHPAVAGWQIDNELGCHSTVRSYGPLDLANFQKWLQNKYSTIDALNDAWGAVFWNEIYSDFSEIDLPNLAVTESNPSAWLDFYRFSSDQVVEYTRAQASVIRKYSPHTFITTNMMGFFFDFDHYKVADLLNFTSWDNYPLGFLATTDFIPSNYQEQYATSGHPDVSSFHHDLYRSMSQSKSFWVMEQQPGPVNWAPYNPDPAPGMIRLWTWEAIAHGADVVSYFRWRQIIYAQEQMHAGLNTPDNEEDVATQEAKQVLEELSELGSVPSQVNSEVAIIFDYETEWLISTQPQGSNFDYIHLTFDFYSTLRQMGLNVDFVRPGQSLKGYDLVIVPSLPIISNDTLAALSNVDGIVVFGPRTGSKTQNFQIPLNLPPGSLQQLIPVKVTRVSSWNSNASIAVEYGGQSYTVYYWTETLNNQAQTVAKYSNGKSAIAQHDNYYYLSFWPGTPDASNQFLKAFLTNVAKEAGLKPSWNNFSVRVQQRGNWNFAFNFGSQKQQTPAPSSATYLLGGATLNPYDLAIWID